MEQARREELLERWWELVDDSSHGCWLWQGNLNHKGYGRFHIKHSSVPAHVFGYEMIVGSIPEGLELDHICKVKDCVKPSHLEPVTGVVNVRRANTHCRKGHLFTPENTYVTPSDGGRRCTICNPKVKPNGLDYKTLREKFNND